MEIDPRLSLRGCARVYGRRQSRPGGTFGIACLISNGNLRRTLRCLGVWLGGSGACLIWRQHGIAECFGTDAALSAREAQLRSYQASAAASTCSSSLDLYSGRNYTGLHLAMWDEGYWQELSYYGFDNLTVSFLGGACAFPFGPGQLRPRLLVSGLHRAVGLCDRHGILGQNRLFGIHRLKLGWGHERPHPSALPASLRTSLASGPRLRTSPQQRPRLRPTMWSLKCS